MLPFAGAGSVRVEGAVSCYGRELFSLFVRAECSCLEAAEWVCLLIAGPALRLVLERLDGSRWAELWLE